MKKIITTLLFVFVLSFATFAQTENKKEESNCPDLSIVGPPSSISSGDLMTFTVKISEDYDDDEVAITWSIDKGTIVKGKGTKTITVSTVGLSDETTTAMVNVVVGDCNLYGAETGITFCASNPVEVDDFGDVKSGDLRARMDAFMADLQNNPGSQGYVINYGSKRYIKNRERSFRNHFNYRGYDLGNIVFVNGGKKKENRTKLWRVPPGADASKID